MHHYSLLSNHTAVYGCVINGKLQSTVKPTRLILCASLFVRPIKGNYLVLLTIYFGSVFIHKNKQPTKPVFIAASDKFTVLLHCFAYQVALSMNPDNTTLNTHIHHHDHQLLLLLVRCPTRQISRHQRKHKAPQN